MIDPDTARVALAGGDGHLRGERPAGEFPGETPGGREPTADPDLGGAVAVASAEPEVMIAPPVDVGLEPFLD